MTGTNKLIFTSNSFGDQYLQEVNGNDFNNLGAHYTFRERFAESLFNPNTLYLVVGSDSLLLPAYIEEKGIPDNSYYIFIEPEEIYPDLQDRCRQINPRFIITPPAELESSLDKIGDLGANHYIFRDQMEIIQSLAAVHDHIDLYARLNAWLSNTLSTIHNRFSSSINLADHITNIIQSCPDNAISEGFLKDLFSNQTIVILAGGPSLEDNFNWVLENRDSLVVIAVSRISQRLHELAIRPDIFIHADAREMGVDTAKGIFHFPDVLFAHTASAPTQLVGQWSGIKTIIDNRLPWPCEINDSEITMLGGNTVTNVAVSLAAWMGASQIILLGVDLCHSPKGFSHAPGSNERKFPPPIHLNLNKVTTNEGGTGYTTHDFFTAAEALDSQGEAVRKQGIRIINPSPKAMRLKQIEHLPVDNIVLNKTELPPLQVLADAYPKTQLDNYLERLERELVSAKNALETMRNQARRSLGELDQITEKNAASVFHQAQLTIELINRNPISKTAIASRWDQFSDALHNSDRGEGELERSRQSKKCYLGRFLDVAEPFADILDRALSRLENRKEEVKISPDFSLLFSQWAKDDQPGRAPMWMQQHAVESSSLDLEIARLMTVFTDRFNSFLSDTGTRHISAVGVHANLDIVIPRVILLFKGSDIEGLNYLLDILSEYPQEQAKPYSLFTAGMLAELKGETGEAIINYQQILETPESPVLEPTLKRVAAICIEAGDMENTLFALESLSDISSEHTPSYAELLATLGYREDAMAVYETYTADHPDDLATLCKYGLLCKQAGDQQQAEKIAHDIIDVHPDFSPARELIDG